MELKHFKPEEIVDQNTLNQAWAYKMQDLQARLQSEVDVLKRAYDDSTKAEREAFEKATRAPKNEGLVAIEPHNLVFKDTMEEINKEAHAVFEKLYAAHKKRVQKLEDKYYKRQVRANKKLHVQDLRLQKVFARKTKKEKAVYDEAVKSRYEKLTAAVEAVNKKYQALSEPIAAEGEALSATLKPTVH